MQAAIEERKLPARTARAFYGLLRAHGDVYDEQMTEIPKAAPSDSPVSALLSSRTNTNALIALFIGGLAIGCGPIFVRLSETSPVATAFWRLLLAQPFLWAVFAREQRQTKTAQKPLQKRDWGRMALVAFFFTGDLAIWH